MLICGCETKPFRESHPNSTSDDLVDALDGAKVLSKLDLRSGYHQLSLAPESRYITTFATHEGLQRYKRLNFGTNSASEIFQHIISKQIRDVLNSHQHQQRHYCVWKNMTGARPSLARSPPMIC